MGRKLGEKELGQGYMNGMEYICDRCIFLTRDYKKYGWVGQDEYGIGVGGGLDGL